MPNPDPNLTPPPFPPPPASTATSPVQSTQISPPSSIDGLIAQSLVSNTVPASPPPLIGTSHKEVIIAPQRPQVESAPLVELREQEPLPPEVQGWLEHKDQSGDIALPKPISQDGNILLAGSDAQVIKEKIVLPMSQAGMQIGLKTKVGNSARWLAEWCLRLVKMMKDGVKFAPENNQTNG